MPRIEFYWDAASPYTYLAATRIEAIAERCNAALIWRPFLVGATFKASGNRMPAEVPAKGRYMLEDLKLWARHYRVPFEWPPVFPVNSLLAQRVACALPEREESAWALAIMRAYWVEGRDIAQVPVVESVLHGQGLDAAAILAAAQSQPAKDRLRRNTEEAVSRGVFGAPSFFVGETLFWGNDRLPLMESYLKGQLAA